MFDTADSSLSLLVHKIFSRGLFMFKRRKSSHRLITLLNDLKVLNAFCEELDDPWSVYLVNRGGARRGLIG